MSYTWGQLKTDVRQILFPSGEAPNLVASHDKAFIDGICDLQQFVQCLQQDQVDVVPACSTYYKCGITMFDAPPHAFIKRVSVIGSDPSGDPDYCKEIEYRQTRPEYIRAWLQRHGRDRNNCFLDFAAFFALDPCLCRKAVFPVPTDEGLAAGLAPLSLGVHYAQGSTDRYRRSRAGVWAIERGVLMIAPWINVTQNPESVLILWDGIKRTWGDNDPVDPDPLLGEALEEFVRSAHSRKHDRDFDVAETAGQAYQNARMKLWHNCRLENVVQEPQGSVARNSAATLVSAGALYYNDTPYAANAIADTSDCPLGETAAQSSTASFTVLAGSVSSTVSVADANAKAQAQAQASAQALAIAGLVCSGTPASTGSGGTTPTPTPSPAPVGTCAIATAAEPYCNPGGTKVTVTCAATATDPNAPTPVGASVTMTTTPGMAVSAVSAQDAETKAVAVATAQATANLVCTYGNSAQTGNSLTCPTQLIPPIVVPAQTTAKGAMTLSGPASQAASLQTAVNNQALNAANMSAQTKLYQSPYNCPNAPAQPGNTQPGYACFTVQQTTVCVTVPVGAAPSNAQAQAMAQSFAETYATSYSAQGQGGSFNITY